MYVCCVCSRFARHEIEELQGQIAAARERYKDNITTSTKGKLSAIPMVSCRVGHAGASASRASIVKCTLMVWKIIL